MADSSKPGRVSRSFSSVEHFARLRAATLYARHASQQNQRLPITSICADYAEMVQWGATVHRVETLLNRLQPHHSLVQAEMLDEAIQSLLTRSANLMTMLRQRQWSLYDALRLGPASANPLLLLHEQLARGVELLLLVRARAAPTLPPEVWALIVEKVLSTSTVMSGGLASDTAEPEGKCRFGCRPVLRHYGFASDGSLRLALDPPAHLPRLKEFRTSVGLAMDVLGSGISRAGTGGEGEGGMALAGAKGRCLAVLSQFNSRSAWDAVRALSRAFALPVPKFVLGAPAVSVTTSVFLADDYGRSSREQRAITRDDHDITDHVWTGDELSALHIDSEGRAALFEGSASTGGSNSRFEGVSVRIHISAIRLRGHLSAETVAAATGS